MVEKKPLLALPLLQGSSQISGALWEMCLPTSIEIHEVGSPLCLSYHVCEPSRTLWHAVLETNHKRVLSLTYCDHEKSRGMIISCSKNGKLCTDVLIGSHKETATGGRLPPNLLGTDKFPTRNPKDIRAIHSHFRRIFGLIDKYRI
jgi:hypothetical protein